MICEGFYGDCERTDAIEFRMNTRYADEERNYRVLCPVCQQHSEEYWADKWAEYYAGCL